MYFPKPAFLAPMAVIVAGCGTEVPNITENPFATEKDRSDFIQEIVRNVRCELQNAVIRVYAENPKDIDPENRNLKWFDSWAAQLSLTLTIDEKSILSPSATVIPDKIFSLGLGATASADAQRVDKVGSFFLIADLKGLQYCNPKDRGTGPFILQSNLKLYDWLKPTIISTDNGDTPLPGSSNGPFKSNVISHEVKFDIVTSGSITPMWILQDAKVNTSGTLFSTSRDRIQDLTITFGPPDPNWTAPVVDPATGKPKIDPQTKQPVTRPIALSPAAASVAAAADISNALTTVFRNTPLQ